MAEFEITLRLSQFGFGSQYSSAAKLFGFDEATVFTPLGAADQTEQPAFSTAGFKDAIIADLKAAKRSDEIDGLPDEAEYLLMFQRGEWPVDPFRSYLPLGISSVYAGIFGDHFSRYPWAWPLTKFGIVNVVFGPIIQEFLGSWATRLFVAATVASGLYDYSTVRRHAAVYGANLRAFEGSRTGLLDRLTAANLGVAAPEGEKLRAVLIDEAQPPTVTDDLGIVRDTQLEYIEGSSTPTITLKPFVVSGKEIALGNPRNSAQVVKTFKFDVEAQAFIEKQVTLQAIHDEIKAVQDKVGDASYKFTVVEGNGEASIAIGNRFSWQRASLIGTSVGLAVVGRQLYMLAPAQVINALPPPAA